MARRRVRSPLPGSARNHRPHVNSIHLSEDATNTESQKVLALKRLLMQPRGDKDNHQFCEKVAADQKKLNALLEHHVQKAKNKDFHRRDKLASTIVEALNRSNRPVQGKTLTFSGTHIAGNTTYTSIMNLMTSSEGLIKEYRRLDDMIAALRTEQPQDVAEKWRDDIDGTDEQLKMGARVALRNVKKVLGAKVEDDDLERLDEDGKVPLEGSDNQRKREINYDLQKSLRYMERGVKRMVKGLPSDENYC